MDSSENGNLLLKQYGRFKRMELKKAPFHFLLASESHIDPNLHQINAFCAAIDAMKTGGMVLADEVGLGKTIEAGLVLRYTLESGAKKVLIALTASLRKQWELELEDKFDLSSVILDRLTVEHDAKNWHRKLADRQGVIIVITSYDYSSKLMKRFPDVKWDFLIIDEAHNLRNLNSTKRAKRLYALSGEIPKILLTATPLQNSLMDLYGLISFIDPRIFGSDLVFRQRYMKDEDYDGLKRELTPMLYRTLRKDVADYMDKVAEPEVFSDIQYRKVDDWGEQTIGAHGYLFIGAMCNNADILFPVLLLCDQEGKYVDFEEDDLVPELEKIDDSTVRYFKPTDDENTMFRKTYGNLVTEMLDKLDRQTEPVREYTRRKIENWIRIQNEQLVVQYQEMNAEIEELREEEKASNNFYEKIDIRKKADQKQKKFELFQASFHERSSRFRADGKREIAEFNRSLEIDNPILLISVVLKF